MIDAHRLAELRSLALHGVIAERLRAQPALLERARARAQTWLRENRSPASARAWLDLLDGPRDELLSSLVRDDERMRTLRSCTPFAGVVPPRERWKIWARVREEAR